MGATPLPRAAPLAGVTALAALDALAPAEGKTVLDRSTRGRRELLRPARRRRRRPRDRARLGPTPENLERLAELLDGGTLRVHIQKSYELAQAGDALQAFPATHTQGQARPRHRLETSALRWVERGEVRVLGARAVITPT
jgi:hypothetical protein